MITQSDIHSGDISAYILNHVSISWHGKVGLTFLIRSMCRPTDKNVKSQ